VRGTYKSSFGSDTTPERVLCISFSGKVIVMKVSQFIFAFGLCLFASNCVSAQQTTSATEKPATPVAEEPSSVPSHDEVQAADEATIRANAVKYVESYNRRDSQSMSEMWSPEAVYMDPRTGEGVVGRSAIKEQFDHALAGQEDAKLTVMIDSIEFISPNVAVETGSAVVTYSDYPAEESTYKAVHVKRDGKWLIDRISESEIPLPPLSNYEHLKPLEWMIGSWIDEDETASVQTDCQWTKNRNFMTRSFAVVSRDGVELSGMQIVGWDAANQQIRSWVFDSTGGFGEGVWTVDGDDWTIQATGTLPDGGKTSATNLLKKIDDNSYTWGSINREANGELQPNVDPVMIVRAPEEAN
jgi:uncharacterized protein (TIGR02246 family)